MKISYNWLSDYILLNDSPEEVAEILTSIGLEVEGIEQMESIRGGLKGLVVGHVKEVSKHPDADKLNCTKVDLGDGNLTPIVCGAPNVAEGQKVIVATVGTMLYTPDGSGFEIKKAKIRGEVSEGMICAEDEIGIGESHDGILVLPADTKVGTPASEVFNIETDYVFEIGLTPNRADAACHFGVARDLKAAYAQRKGMKIQLCQPSVDAFKPTSNNLVIPVEVQNVEACPRYVGVSIADVEVKASPDWLQNRLKAIGIRPINNVVDITNYVNHAFGQPLHAFDAGQIKGGKVLVKTLPAKTKFITLDEVERDLDERDLMICDANGGMCIAGVFGGMHSGVTTTTKNIFLESAYFDPVWIRKTAKRHALNTDASFRFERGIDPNNTLYAAKYAAMLITEIAGGTIASELSDTHPTAFPPFNFTFRPSKANALIGMEINEKVMEDILTNLDISIKQKQGSVWHLEVPPYKVDVTREADVIEEVLRIYGYDNVPFSDRLRTSVQDIRPTIEISAKKAVTDMLVSNGFLECMTNSMTDQRYTKISREWHESEVVYLSNPLSSELGIMRPAMVISALQNASYNINRQQTNIKLFEFGNVYRRKGEGFNEEGRFSLIVSGNELSDHWRQSDLNADWYTVKAALELIAQRLGVDLSKLKAEETDSDWFDFGMDWKRGDRIIISAGKITTPLAKKFDVKRDLFYLELRWSDLLKTRDAQIQIGELPKYPMVKRDLALLIDDEISYSALEQLAYQTEKKILRNVRLFDVYTGKGLPENKKSYALSFDLRDDQKTLTDKEVDKTMHRLLERFKREVNAELR